MEILMKSEFRFFTETKSSVFSHLLTQACIFERVLEPF